ncbi:MAG: hypothetical protein A3D89_04325 [Planctomycetes bacterium RIFCSPHIGHO2_02_FULL_52_58]|nr:MAG: hypothetical protein A3D89_04325 [Planctomycetes bacterium RIFCSPHIGHO2_02_FULL_52_58]
MLPLFCLLPTVCCHKGGVTPPLLCLLFTVYCLLILATPVSSETMGWVATYGGANHERAHSIRQTADGGYVVAGYTESFSTIERHGQKDRDIWVLKLRADGAVEWQKTYGGDNADEAHSIQQTSDGGYIVAGWTLSFDKRGVCWVLKLNSVGNVEWQKLYGGDGGERADSIQQTSDGGYVVAGKTRSFGAGKVDFWVLKLRPDGTVDWEKTYGGEDWDDARSIQQTRDGGYVVAGSTSSFVTRGEETPDMWVLKLRSDGVIEWQKTYGGDNWDSVNSIQQTLDGGYIIAGETRSFGNENGDFWVLKLRTDGTVEWQKTYGGDRGDRAYSVQQATDGGYIVGGDTGSFGAGGGDFWVLKLRPDGSVEWQRTYGGTGGEDVHSVQQTRDGGYVVAGCTFSFGAGKGDFWVLKLRADGSIDPSCDLVRDTNISDRDSTAQARNTRTARESNANPKDSSATVRDTNGLANFLCPQAAVEGLR